MWLPMKSVNKLSGHTVVPAGYITFQDEDNCLLAIREVEDLLERETLQTIHEVFQVMALNWRIGLSDLHYEIPKLIS